MFARSSKANVTNKTIRREEDKDEGGYWNGLQNNRHADAQIRLVGSMDTRSNEQTGENNSRPSRETTEPTRREKERERKERRERNEQR